LARKNAHVIWLHRFRRQARHRSNQDATLAQPLSVANSQMRSAQPPLMMSLVTGSLRAAPARETPRCSKSDASFGGRPKKSQYRETKSRLPVPERAAVDFEYLDAGMLLLASPFGKIAPAKAIRVAPAA